jgi:LmbE family N-acetylglucosaminyl deacetylase
MMRTELTNIHQPRILGVFAHPDDEVFCAGGTLARYTAAGAEAMVVSATRGQAGQIRDGRVATRQTLGQVREQELRTACARLGVQHARCLDYLDGTLAAATPATLTDALGAIIDSFAPDVVITFGPDGGYGHPDHVAISAAVTTACARQGRSGHSAPRLFYSHFPRRRLLLCTWLARWLLDQPSPFRASGAYAHALALLAEGAGVMGLARDAVGVRWFPAGLSIVEQGEPSASLYLLMSGHVEVVRESGGMRWVLHRLGPGDFFGARELARQQPHDASVTTIDDVTCLVLSANYPTTYAGRGAHANTAVPTASSIATTLPQRYEHVLSLETGADIGQKIAALASHRSQYPIEPEMFPVALLRDLFDHEHFVAVNLDMSRVAAGPRQTALHGSAGLPTIRLLQHPMPQGNSGVFGIDPRSQPLRRQSGGLEGIVAAS